MSWDATNYQDDFSYIWRNGESLLAQLNPQAGEHILDLGCGTGQLTQQIAESGAKAVGIDSDRAMITKAQTNYPHLTFKVADAANFQLETPVDAVFSNAALHWVAQAEAAAGCIVRSLKPGGRFVAELGGKGNVQTILAALEKVSGRSDLNPWYFPSVGEYTTLLEASGLEVTFATLFNRPTPLGKAGLAGWLKMFGQRFFSDLKESEWVSVVEAVEKEASKLYQADEWVADYRRLRVVATRIV